MHTNPAPIDVGQRRQLLFDQTFFQTCEGFTVTMHSATCSTEPVLAPVMPWEKESLWRWVSVVEDRGVYHLWYDAWSHDETGEFHRVPHLCHATSTDGLHWERPEHGVVEFEGSKNNNIVFEGLGNPNIVFPKRKNFVGCGNVFKDPSAHPDERFKYIFTDNHTKSAEESLGGGLVYGAVSSDGVHWRPCKTEPIIPWYGDTMNVCFWDDRIKKYVAYVRWDEGHTLRNGKWGYYEMELAKQPDNPTTAMRKGNMDAALVGHVRSVGRAESDDFTNFPAPVRIMWADEFDDWNVGLYYSAATKYPYADNAYFMFPGAFNGEYYDRPDTIEAQLAVSRDGIVFSRFREPFIRLGIDGGFDCCMIDMGVGVVRRQHELLMYYNGRQVGHAEAAHRTPGCGAIGVARLRLDGFVSQDASQAGGVITTVPIRHDGNRLLLNMDAAATGWLKIEVLDEHGAIIDGFGGDHADRLYGNHVHRLVTWGNQPDATAIRNRPVRLRISGRSARLYAFQFVDHEHEMRD